MTTAATRAHDSLVRACMDLLAMRAVPATRVNQKPQLTKKGWRSQGADPGTTDIVACLPPSGRVLLIENKTGKARITGDQAAFIIRWTDAGAAALVIHDVADLDAALQTLLAKEATRCAASPHSQQSSR